MPRTIAIGYFPGKEFDQAMSMWPHLLDGWQTHGYTEYCHEVDRRLRALEVEDDAKIRLAPIELKPYLKWCVAKGVDAGAAETRSSYAMEMTTRGRFLDWPPKRDKGCWCGRDASYADCCGRD